MYFDSPGKVNTEQTLEQAAARAEALGITEVVVASSSGNTALMALERMPGARIVAVTYHCGFREPFQPVMTDEARKDLESKGVAVISATHALSGVERSVAKKHGGVYPALIVADALRMLGQGTKVAVEVTLMAADAGSLTGADIVAIGGSSRGADTALVVKPSISADMFGLQVREVICKPREF